MHREIIYIEHNEKAYEELYQKLKKEGGNVFSLEWITWQINDSRFMNKEQAFDLLNFLINRYAEDMGSLNLNFYQRVTLWYKHNPKKGSYDYNHLTYGYNPYQEKPEPFIDKKTNKPFKSQKQWNSFKWKKIKAYIHKNEVKNF